ncbi:MAG TPA: GAF domain-containing protein, partial [Thermoanaerobaculia bacterium]
MKVLGVRVSAAILLLLFPASSHVQPNESKVIGLYLAATLVLAVASRHAIEQRFLRLIANFIDVVGISMLIALMGAIHSAWLVLLYVFPITAVSRYLGLKWSVPVSLLAALGYGLATASRPVSPSAAFGLMAVMLILVGVAFNAAKLARSRDRFEARISTTIDEIYEQLLANRPLCEVMDSILRAALQHTRSDMTAIILAGAVDGSEFFASTSVSASTGNPIEARRILEKHYNGVLRPGTRSLSLVKHPFLAKVFGKNAVAEPPWAGRLIPITIGTRPFGVLGVFSHRSVHYTNEDIDKLSSLRPLIALAQQNAFLSQELVARNQRSNARLQLLYQIGKQLQEHEGSATVFQNVVALVSEYVGSEEAALFIPDDRGPLLKKVAVAGPDPKNTDRLRALELTEDPDSLTGQVFYGKAPIVENDIPRSEPHAAEYSKELPSLITKHYMGVPVLIGVGSAVSDRPLGVIRVLNKQGSRYDIATGVVDLDPTGFVKDDLELLTAIATYIAGAMRNAMFIEKSRHFEGLIHKLPDPIIVIDRDGYIQNFNRECEKIWNIREKQAIGRHVTGFYESPEHAREIGRELEDAADHTIYSRDARVRSFDGQV